MFTCVKGDHLLTETKGLFLALIQHYFIQRNIKETYELGFCSVMTACNLYSAVHFALFVILLIMSSVELESSRLSISYGVQQLWLKLAMDDFQEKHLLYLQTIHFESLNKYCIVNVQQQWFVIRKNPFCPDGQTTSQQKRSMSTLSGNNTNYKQMLIWTPKRKCSN